MKDNKIKLLTEILAIVVIVLVSFVGVYKQKDNKIENQVKEYQYSKDLDGYREVLLEVSSTEDTSEEEKEDSSTSETSDENKDTENNEENKEEEKSEVKDSQNNYEDYIKSKKVIEKRLELLGVQDYTISQNTENGSIYLQLPENKDTDRVLSNLLQVGKIEIKDSEDASKVYINNDNLKNVSTVYNTDTDGTTVYLKFEFNKDGKKTLKELSTGEYKTSQEDNKTETESSEDKEDENSVEAKVEGSDDVEVDTSSENEEEKKDTQKKIKLSIDESDLITTSFDDPIENGAINLSMNKPSKDQTSINDTLQSASTISSVLKSGTMPLKYEIKQNAYIQTDINGKKLNTIYIIIGVIFAISLAYLIVKYKTKGIIASIASIGFLALDLLIVRYTNLIISLESIIAGSIVLIINYIIVNDFLKTQENTKLTNIFKFQIFKAIPIILIAIIFSFTKVTKISTCGMFLFWGVTISFIYNYIVTRDMIK